MKKIITFNIKKNQKSTVPFIWINSLSKNSEVLIKITGGNSSFILPCLIVLSGNKTFNLKVVAESKYPSSKTELIFRILLFGKVNFILKCRFGLKKGAENSFFKFGAKALMFQDSSVEISPYLESEERNSAAEHKVWTGKITPEEMFYLQSRGIGETEIFRLFISGFVKEIFPCLNFSEKEKELLSQKVLKIISKN